jgi:putative membrane-bound dehydrogenase-like protein
MKPLFAFATLLVAAFPSNAAVEELKPKPGLPPLAYQTTEHPMPNYVAGERWGVEGERITTMQAPLSPAASAERIVLRSGFRADLWAAEPAIYKPVTMAFDDRGRLWIAETIDYPNELQKSGEGRDRITICEDTDSDGKADKFTVFADKLSIPTAMCHANGGLIVIESGRTLFLKDTNGDDKADERRELFSGWGMGDTHATASNIRYGHDNWIWGVVGYSGFNGEVGGKQVRFGMGVFRFKADGSALEFVRSSNNNTWGLGLAEDGIVFGSTANNNAAWYMPIANRYYEAVNGWSAARMESIADSQAYYPIAQHIRQVDQHGKYTAGAGAALYTARSFPQEYWNRVSFVTEATGHLIGQFRLEGKGADFIARNEKNFLASDDEWFSPIMAEVGPDGALWVLDWYNYIIQHNPVPNGFKNGKGNAYETPLRDKTHGRIYRVTHSAGKSAPVQNLAGASGTQLVAALKSEVMGSRLVAQRHLVERGDSSVVPSLKALIEDGSVDSLGLNPGALHALWTLHGLGVPAPASALKHRSAAVRRAAIMTLPANAGSSVITGAGLTEDPDSQVRLAAFLGLTGRSGDDAAQAIVAAMTKPENTSDRWLREALTAAAASHHAAFLPLALSRTGFPEGGSEVLKIVARHQAGSGSANLAAVIAAAGAPDAVAAPVLEGFTAGWKSLSAPELKPDDIAVLKKLSVKAGDSTKLALFQLAAAWDRKDAFSEEIAALGKHLVALVGDSQAETSVRVGAARNLIALSDTQESVTGVLSSIGNLASPELATGLINALSTSRLPQAGAGLIGRWSDLSPAMRRAAAGILLRRKEWALELLSAVGAGNVPVGDLSRDNWNQLRRHPDGAVAAKAREVQQAGAPKSSAELEAAIAKLMPVANEAGDSAHGREVFEKNCIVCHALSGKGAQIGPDLTGIGVRPKAEILVEILDPNRSVEANYRLWTVTTKDGESLAGRLDAETATSVEILDTAGTKHVVQRNTITKLEASGQSIMPGGFEQLPPKDLTDLLTYLAEAAKEH